MAIAPDSSGLKHIAQSLRLVADALETMQLTQSTTVAATQPAPKERASPPSNRVTPDAIPELEQARACPEGPLYTHGSSVSTKGDSRSSGGQKIEDKVPSQYAASTLVKLSDTQIILRQRPAFDSASLETSSSAAESVRHVGLADLRPAHLLYEGKS
jgi:hypothetical protein